MDFFQLSRTTLPTASKRLFVFGGVGLLVVAAVLFAYFGTEIRANERKGSKGPPAIPVSVAQVAQEVVPFRLQALDNATLNLEYCTIRSPIDGYPGKIQIQMGNLVKANDTLALVVINQVHPIYVNFSVPEQQLRAVRGYMSSGPLAVEALAPGSDQPATSGTLVFVDNAVDPSTGTIKLRAQFQNSENALWPGQFVNVRIKLYDQKDALVVPSRSVQTGPAGQYVFVVKPDMTTEVRKVTVERIEGDSAIIATGLEKGERVVTQGQLRLGAGAKVVVKS